MKKPNLPRRLFWEFRFDEMDWEGQYRVVIERVLDWGMEEEIGELIRFYGFARVKEVFRNEPMYLVAHTLDRACKIFGVEKEETACYKRKMERGFGWV